MKQILRAAFKAIREEYYKDILAFLGPFVIVGVIVLINYLSGGYKPSSPLIHNEAKIKVDNITEEVAIQ